MALFDDLCYSTADIRLLIEYHESYSSILLYFDFVMSLVTCLVGLLGNAVVIFVTGFIMKKQKSKYWFLNLAIVDFFSLLTIPLHAITIFKGTWIFGPYICKVFLFCIYANMHASIFILISLNIARVLSVAQPMFHLKYITQRISFWICSFIWFITALSSLPVFFYGGEVRIGDVNICSFFGSQSFDAVLVNNGYNASSEKNATGDILDSFIYTKFNPFFEQCSSDTCCGGEKTLHFWNHLIFTSKQFTIPFLVIVYFIPLVIIIICNITIIVHVRKSKTVNTQRLYRIVLMIILVYFITWTPYVIAEIMLLIAVHNMNLILMFNVLTFMPLLINIAHTNSCLNPIVYVLSGGRMQTGLNDFISSIRNNQT